MGPDELEDLRDLADEYHSDLVDPRGPGCPSVTDLLDTVLGAASAETSEAVREHARPGDGCVLCRGLMESFGRGVAGSDDTVDLPIDGSVLAWSARPNPTSGKAEVSRFGPRGDLRIPDPVPDTSLAAGTTAPLAIPGTTLTWASPDGRYRAALDLPDPLTAEEELRVRELRFMHAARHDGGPARNSEISRFG